MHDIKDLRKNLQDYKKQFSNRNYDFDLETFQSLDNTNRKLINEKEKLEQEKKILSKSQNKNNFEKSKNLSEQIQKIFNDQKTAQIKINNFLYNLPNVATDDVPIGKDEKSNKLITKVGSIKKLLILI